MKEEDDEIRYGTLDPATPFQAAVAAALARVGPAGASGGAAARRARGGRVAWEPGGAASSGEDESEETSETSEEGVSEEGEEDSLWQASGEGEEEEGEEDEREAVHGRAKKQQQQQQQQQQQARPATPEVIEVSDNSGDGGGGEEAGEGPAGEAAARGSWVPLPSSIRGNKSRLVARSHANHQLYLASDVMARLLPVGQAPQVGGTPTILTAIELLTSGGGDGNGGNSGQIAACASNGCRIRAVLRKDPKCAPYTAYLLHGAQTLLDGRAGTHELCAVRFAPGRPTVLQLLAPPVAAAHSGGAARSGGERGGGGGEGPPPLAGSTLASGGEGGAADDSQRRGQPRGSGGPAATPLAGAPTFPVGGGGTSEERCGPGVAKRALQDAAAPPETPPPKRSRQPGEPPAELASGAPVPPMARPEAGEAEAGVARAAPAAAPPAADRRTRPATVPPEGVTRVYKAFPSVAALAEELGEGEEALQALEAGFVAAATAVAGDAGAEKRFLRQHYSQLRIAAATSKQAAGEALADLKRELAALLGGGGRGLV